MKRYAVVLILFSLVLSACSPKVVSPTEAIQSGTYDWESAREMCITDITSVLEVMLAGDATSYVKARNTWIPRVKPEVQSRMFPTNYTPPKDCLVTVVYRGYSAPGHNSEKSEYILFDAYVMNNSSLSSVDYTFTVRLDRGTDGYIITGFDKQVHS